MILKLKDSETIYRLIEEKGFHVEKGYEGTHINMGKAGDYFLRNINVKAGFINIEDEQMQSVEIEGVQLYLGKKNYGKGFKKYPKFIFIDMKDKLDTILKEE